MRLVCKKSDYLDDWYLIERAEHNGQQWLEKIGPNSFSLECSSRFSDADIEGHADEMLAMAKAIRGRGYISFRRCAVDARSDPVGFCSPRNSQRKGYVLYSEALELSEQIERDIGHATRQG